MDDNKNNNNRTNQKAFDRPLKVDEASYDPLTISRMTDHNVRGSDASVIDSGPREVDNRFSRKPKK